MKYIIIYLAAAAFCMLTIERDKAYMKEIEGDRHPLISDRGHNIVIVISLIIGSLFWPITLPEYLIKKFILKK